MFSDHRHALFAKIAGSGPMILVYAGDVEK